MNTTGCLLYLEWMRPIETRIWNNSHPLSSLPRVRHSNRIKWWCSYSILLIGRIDNLPQITGAVDCWRDSSPGFWDTRLETLLMVSKPGRMPALPRELLKIHVCDTLSGCRATQNLLGWDRSAAVLPRPPVGFPCSCTSTSAILSKPIGNTEEATVLAYCRLPDQCSLVQLL